MIGKSILHYKIIEKLGEGGMGVVYLAEDKKLERQVAIKFLPHHISANSDERKRFEIEAKAAAALNHPNIATIHAIEETEDELFLVMEYISGTHLKDYINGQPLSAEEAVSMATQIAKGLHAAHNKGIVHRDIKSSNIMRTDKGKVKIMDFGLAKIRGSAQVTQTGTTVGTAAYMSPEQARGSDVDQRADIWSFGVVLYEILTGRLPFEGDYDRAVIYNILNEQPANIAEINNLANIRLTEIVTKCLQKEPAHRFQNMSEIIEKLNSITRGTSFSQKEIKPPVPGKSGNKKKIIVIVTMLILAITSILYFMPWTAKESIDRIPIAVVDFINETNEPELNGLSGMLITSLEQSRRLTVVTRSRMFDILKQMDKTDVAKIDETLGREICQKANIGVMAIAAIRKFGQLYTIDLKVIDPFKNEYLFTTKEEAQGQESIPSMLDRLSEKTRIEMNERIGQVKENSQKVASVTTTNLEAYQHYFQGEQFINQLKFKKAVEEFKKAVSLDSTFAQAFYRMAYAENWQNQSEIMQKEHLDQAFKYVSHMPEKEQYLLKAQYANLKEGYQAGIAVLKQMEKLYPDDKEMNYNIGDWSYHEGNTSIAESYLIKTLNIDPAHLRAIQHLTWVYRDKEDYNKMLEMAKSYVAVSGSFESYKLLSSAYSQLGKNDEGLQLMKQAGNLFLDNYQAIDIIADFYIYNNEYVEAEQELLKYVEKTQPDSIKRYGYNRLAEFYPYLGKYRQAIECVDQAVRLSWKTGDSTRALVSQMYKASLFLYGWDDIKKAWKESEKTIPFKSKISALTFWGPLNLMQVYHGDFEQAEEFAEKIPLKWHYYQIKSLIYCYQLNEERASAYADSAFQSNPFFSKILMLYPLAECQYEKGLTDKAIESLEQLQKLKDNSWGYRSTYYPKSFYLMAKIYQKKGDKNNSEKNFELFLNLWKNADPDLPDLIDAKKRLAALKDLI